MKSIKEKAEEAQIGYDDIQAPAIGRGFVLGANYVLDEIEKELTRKMLEDYNEGVEEDEIAQGCMASMIMFVRQLKK